MIAFAVQSVEAYYLNPCDTVVFTTFPPSDSTYVKNHIVIKFKPNAIKLENLCYGEPARILNVNYKTYLMNQKFYVGDLIVDQNFLNAIKSFGGDSLDRLTWANPCTDTLSITRCGDTIKCDDFLWMRLYFSNDTSVISACTILTIFYQSQIESAEPDYYVKLLATPNDAYYVDGYQESLYEEGGINIEPAWDKSVGNYKIKIGIIDNGIQWSHCDLGGGWGLGYRVSSGFDFVQNTDDLDLFDSGNHGTPIAGIIGALTNSTSCRDEHEEVDYSIAGIAGGWGKTCPWDNDPDDSHKGCQLLSFKYNINIPGITDTSIWLSRAVAAIRVASSNSPNPYPGFEYGYGCNIINNSWKVYHMINGITYSEYVRRAVNYAFENCVNVVCARGNEGNELAEYPACCDPSWVTSVGGSHYDKTMSWGSSYGKQMDILAPYGEPPGFEATYARIWSTQIGENDNYQSVAGTSFAAPHVAGVMGLLYSYKLDNNWCPDVKFEPEDYEGMNKASALDITPDYGSDPFCDNDYDIYSGWGHLQANKIFQMICNDNYKIYHFSTSEISYGDWIPGDNEKLSMAFGNSSNVTDKPLPVGVYQVKYRECTGTINLPDIWKIDENNKLYVWGRSNRLKTGGYDFPHYILVDDDSYLQPNYQTTFTQVTSGTGGNGLTDGIIHSQSLNVEARTCQYDVWDASGTNYIGRYPPNEQIALNISVFGIETIESLNEPNSNSTNNSIKIIPNPANTNSTKLLFEIYEPANVEINIYDILGNSVFALDREYMVPGIYHKDLSFHNLCPGVYICNIQINEKVLTIKFTVLK